MNYKRSTFTVAAAMLLFISVWTTYAQPQRAGNPVPKPVGTPITPRKTTPPAGSLLRAPCLQKAVTITDGVLHPGNYFPTGSMMWSPNHVYHLVLDPQNGDLLVYDNVRLDGQYIHPIWKSDTANKGVACGHMDHMGQFSLEDASSKTIWHPSHTVLPTKDITDKYSLVLQNDGTLTLSPSQNDAGVAIYHGSDQNKKPDPKYIGDTTFKRWNKGQSLKPGTRLYSPDMKVVLVCDETGLWLRDADMNQVSFPTYVSTKLKEVISCEFQLNGILAAHQPGLGKGWHSQTLGLGGTYVEVDGKKNEVVMMNGKSSPPQTVWTSGKN